MLNFKLKHLEWIEKTLKNPITEKKTCYVFNNLNKYIDLKKLDEYIKGEYRLKDFNDSQSDKSSTDSIRGRLCEEIVAYGIQSYLKESGYDNDIIIDSKSKNIDEYFSIFTAQNKDLQKRIDVDLLLHNNNNDKFYALSVKGTTRERVAQSQLALFLLDKKSMEAKYNSTDKEFNCLLWKNESIRIKYGIVVYDFGKNKDYAKKTPKGNLRKNNTREFDVEMFYQDKILVVVLLFWII